MKLATNQHSHILTSGHSLSAKPATQKGAVLILALVMMTVLTLIGVSSMSSSSLELKVASNAQQHNTAFQAAQSRIAFSSAIDPVNPINFLIAIDLNNPPYPVQVCDPPACPDGANWAATAQVTYLDCATGLGSSLEAGKGFSYRFFEVTAAGVTAPGGVVPASPARSTQVGAVRYPVKGCGDEI